LQPRGRIGLRYELTPGLSVSGVYTFFHQQVVYTADTFAAAVLGPPTVPSGRFKTSDTDIGIAYEFSNGVVGVERIGRRTKGPNFVYDDAGYNIGAEVHISPHWDLRAGAHEGRLSAGFGYHDRDTRIDYAFMANREGDTLRNLVGSSKGHFLAYSRSF